MGNCTWWAKKYYTHVQKDIVKIKEVFMFRVQEICYSGMDAARTAAGAAAPAAAFDAAAVAAAPAAALAAASVPE